MKEIWEIRDTEGLVRRGWNYMEATGL